MKKYIYLFLALFTVISCKKDEGKIPVLSFVVNARNAGSSPFTITAPVSESDGSFTYSSSNPAVASVSGNTITVAGVGQTTITATQAASGSFSSATVSATFEVLPQGAPLKLGQWYQGGIIFYLNAANGGMIISDQEVAYTPWSSGKLVIVGTELPLGTGLSNTDKIITSMGGEGDYAAWKARNYKGGGHSDWYLPSVEDLAIIRSRMDMIGGMKQTNYWCSTEYNISQTGTGTPISHAYFIYFGPYLKDSSNFTNRGKTYDGQTVWINNTFKEKFRFAVRAVRSF